MFVINYKIDKSVDENERIQYMVEFEMLGDQFYHSDRGSLIGRRSIWLGPTKFDQTFGFGKILL